MVKITDPIQYPDHLLTNFYLTSQNLYISGLIPNVWRKKITVGDKLFSRHAQK